VYLESSAEGNNSYYAKFGFEVKRKIVFERSPDRIRMWSMVREPQALKPVCTAAAALLPAMGGRVTV
jgi:hypothetical protein